MRSVRRSLSNCRHSAGKGNRSPEPVPYTATFRARAASATFFFVRRTFELPRAHFSILGSPCTFSNTATGLGTLDFRFQASGDASVSASINLKPRSKTLQNAWNSPPTIPAMLPDCRCAGIWSIHVICDFTATAGVALQRSSGRAGFATSE